MFSLIFSTKRKRISMEFMSEDFFDNFWSDAKLKMKEIHKYLMEGFLEYEVEQFLGAQKYQRIEARLGYRNGYYNRKSLLTDAFGELSGFKVPRVRGTLFRSKILHRYQRHTKDIWQIVLTIYINGQSIRRAKKTFHKIFGSDLSTSTISKMLQKTQEKLDSRRKQPINAKYILSLHSNLF